jgi:uncharacterized protein
MSSMDEPTFKVPPAIRQHKAFAATAASVAAYMADYDCSHDFEHVKRVLGLALHIASQQPADKPAPDLLVVALAALLHDVDDRKYRDLKAGAATNPMAQLRERDDVTQQTKDSVAAICQAVSWSTEMKDKAFVEDTLRRLPELGIVQDADRLDAIGAVGIARVFAFGAAKRPERGLKGSVDHFDQKLLKVEHHMKTEEGRQMARERTEILTKFKESFLSEAAFAEQEIL